MADLRPEFRSFRSDLSRSAGLLPGVASAADVQFVHLVQQRCSFQSEALRRSALTTYLPGGSSQRIGDDLPLGLFEC